MRWIGLLLLFALACRSTDPSFRSRSGERLSDLDPLPYRVAIANLESDRELSGDEVPGQLESLWFTFNARGVQQFLVTVLDRHTEPAKEYRVKSLRTFNQTLAVPRPGLDAAIDFARDERADLLIVPRLVDEPVFDYKRINGRWATSAALWITWIAGLFVQDREYRAILSIEFDLVNPHDGTVIDTFTAASRSIDADQWERMNKNFWTAQTAYSLVLPAFWVPDNHTDASRSTTARVCARLAAQLTGHLKEDYVKHARALTGTLQGVFPRNGVVVGPEPFSFRARVVGEQLITDIAIYVGDSDTPAKEWRETVLDTDDPNRIRALPDLAEQGKTGIYAVDVRLDGIPCDGQEQHVRVEFAVNGRYASQTFVYVAGKRARED